MRKLNIERPRSNIRVAKSGRSSLDISYRRTQLFWFIISSFLVGCGSPSAANIGLRKQNQALQAQVDQLSERHRYDADALAACQRSHPTTASLSPERLDALVTTRGLTFGRLTGGYNPDPTALMDTQLKVFVVPVDAEGTPIKSAGTFAVEAYDLDDPAKPLVGKWNFDLNRARVSFYSRLALYTYVLDCPFQNKPAHPNVTIHVTFEDALTGWKFEDQVRATVRLTATQP